LVIMAEKYPSRFEMKLSGCALVCSQIMLMIGGIIYSIDNDIYEVRTDEQVVEMHEILSSAAKRREVEILCGITWFTFPLMLISLYGITKLTYSIYNGTSAEILIYLAEKSYIMYIAVVCIILPAMMLVTVSYEWSIHEYTEDPDDSVDTLYYVQLGMHTMVIEIADCVAIADAVFLISLFLLPRMLLIFSGGAESDYLRRRFKELKFALEPSCCHSTSGIAKCGFEICTNCFVLSLIVVFCMVLFTFAESGFFAPTGEAQFLGIWAVLVKIMLGVRMIWFGASNQWSEVRKVIIEHDKRRMSTQNMLGGQDRRTSTGKNDDNVL